MIRAPQERGSPSLLPRLPPVLPVGIAVRLPPTPGARGREHLAGIAPARRRTILVFRSGRDATWRLRQPSRRRPRPPPRRSGPWDVAAARLGYARARLVTGGRSCGWRCGWRALLGGGNVVGPAEPGELPSGRRPGGLTENPGVITRNSAMAMRRSATNTRRSSGKPFPCPGPGDRSVGKQEHRRTRRLRHAASPVCLTSPTVDAMPRPPTGADRWRRPPPNRAESPAYRFGPPAKPGRCDLARPPPGWPPPK